MSDPSLIGLVSLTTHLSSMNPLGSIEPERANHLFGTAVIQATYKTYLESSNKSDLLSDGIVIEGSGAKYFHFRQAEDLVCFVKKLRAFLVEERVPFKLNVKNGSLNHESVAERWRAVIDKDDLTDAERDELASQFGTSEKREIEKIFELYRASGYTDDLVRLREEMEDFKGFGVCFSDDLKSALSQQSGFFFNAFSRFSKGKSTQIFYFLDVVFDFHMTDVVTIEQSKSGRVPQFVAAGSKSIVDGATELMKVSVTADDSNGSFYISLFVNFIRSSNFRKMTYYEKADEDEETGIRLAMGFQHFPPIFERVVDLEFAQVMRKAPGIELMVGALIDEIHSQFTEKPSVCRVSSTGLDRAAPTLLDHQTFAHAIRVIQIRYGKVTLRKVLALPDRVVSRAAQKTALAILSA